MLAVHHAQHMPSLKQAVAAAMPASRADAMQKLAGRPAFPASRAASAMVARASASIASLPAISTLQAGLEAGAAFPLGTAAVHSGRLAQGAARATRLDKQRSAAAAHVEDVYCRMQVGPTGRGGAWVLVVGERLGIWSLLCCAQQHLPATCLDC